jgi:hypothetical protein
VIRTSFHHHCDAHTAGPNRPPKARRYRRRRLHASKTRPRFPSVVHTKPRNGDNTKEPTSLPRRPCHKRANFHIIVAAYTDDIQTWPLPPPHVALLTARTGALCFLPTPNGGRASWDIVDLPPSAGDVGYDAPTGSAPFFHWPSRVEPNVAAFVGRPSRSVDRHEGSKM